MEESDDGTHVTGNWEGQIDAAGVVRGTGPTPLNPAIVLPFAIRPLGLLVIPPFDMRPSSGITYAPPPPVVDHAALAARIRHPAPRHHHGWEGAAIAGKLEAFSIT